MDRQWCQILDPRGRPRKREASDPVGVASANDGTGRIFVVERVGRIKVVAKDGRVLPDPYLDDKGAVANPPGALWRVLPQSQVPAGAQTAPAPSGAVRTARRTAAGAAAGLMLVAAGALAPGPFAAALAPRHIAFGTPLDATPRLGVAVTAAVTRFHETGQNPYVGDAGALTDGKRLYDTWCQSCHMPDGSGRIGPSLIGPQHIYERTATDVGLFEAVFGGALGAMQSFRDRLTQDEILKVTAYVQSLRRGSS